MSQRSKIILFTLGVLVIAETYLFGFNNTNDKLFSGTHSNALLLAGVLLILVPVILLFIQFYQSKKSSDVASKVLENANGVNNELQQEFVEKNIPIENVIPPFSVNEEGEVENAIADLITTDGDALNPEREFPIGLTEQDITRIANEIMQLIDKAETLLQNFTIEVWGRDKKEDFTGMEAATIHLNRIAILYNDPKQFRNRFTGYDRRLIEVMDYYLQAVDLHAQLSGFTSEIANEAEEKLSTFYKNSIKELTLHYRGMINRLYQKDAIQLFAPIMDRIKQIQKSAQADVSKRLIL